jgi:multisubunit Na+/H+ antiporter MnhB subunit
MAADRELAHEQRVAAERAYAADIARQRRRHKIRLEALTAVGVIAFAAGVFAGGLGFVAGLVVLGVAIAVAIRMGTPPNKPEEQARQTPTGGGGPFV